MPYPTPGRALITLSSLVVTVGGFYMDWSETHIHNPRWPPHAKFHNGQTMSAAILLTLLTIFYTYRPATTVRELKDSLTTAALVNSVYTVSGLTAVLYPGAKGMDPEFGEGFPQGWLFAGLCIANWYGWRYERAALDRSVARGVEGLVGEGFGSEDFGSEDFGGKEFVEESIERDL